MRKRVIHAHLLSIVHFVPKTEVCRRWPCLVLLDRLVEAMMGKIYNFVRIDPLSPF